MTPAEEIREIACQLHGWATEIPPTRGLILAVSENLDAIARRMEQPVAVAFPAGGNVVRVDWRKRA